MVEYKSTGILCQLKAVHDIDDVLRRDAEKSAAEASAANRKTWKTVGARVKVGVDGNDHLVALFYQPASVSRSG